MLRALVFVGALLVLGAPVMTAEKIDVGYIAFDQTDFPFGGVDVENLTGPNASLYPDGSYPVVTPVSFANLILKVKFFGKADEIFDAKSGYFSLSPDGLSYEGQQIFDQSSAQYVESVGLGGTFSSTLVQLNDGTDVQLPSGFYATIVSFGGSTSPLQDGDFAQLSVNATPVSATPEPGTGLLLLCSVAFLSAPVARVWRGRSAGAKLLGTVLLVGATSALSAAPPHLSAWTIPSSAVAGSDAVWLTVSGVPAGTWPFEVSIGGACGASEAVGAPVLQRTLLSASAYRIQFWIPPMAKAGTYFVQVSWATGGGAVNSDCARMNVTAPAAVAPVCAPYSAIGLATTPVQGKPASVAAVWTTPSNVFTPGFALLEGSTPPILEEGSCYTSSGNEICAALLANGKIVPTGVSLQIAGVPFTIPFEDVSINPLTNEAALTFVAQGFDSDTGYLTIADLTKKAVNASIPYSWEGEGFPSWDSAQRQILVTGGSVGLRLFLATKYRVTEYYTDPGYAPLYNLQATGEECLSRTLVSSAGPGLFHLFDLSRARYYAVPDNGYGFFKAPGSDQSVPEIQSAGQIVFASGSTLGLVMPDNQHSQFSVIKVVGGTASAEPALADFVVFNLPAGPDGLPFPGQENNGAAYISPNSGKTYGVALLQGGDIAYFAKMDLAAILSAPRSSAHVLNASYDLLGRGIVTYVKK